MSDINELFKSEEHKIDLHRHAGLESKMRVNLCESEDYHIIVDKYEVEKLISLTRSLLRWKEARGFEESKTKDQLREANKTIEETQDAIATLLDEMARLARIAEESAKTQSLQYVLKKSEHFEKAASRLWLRKIILDEMRILSSERLGLKVPNTEDGEDSDGLL